MKDLKEFSEAMRQCSNVEYSGAMKQISDNCLLWLETFYLHPTSENLKNLNGAWALATRLLKNTPPEGNPAPLSGAPEATRLAA